MKFRGFINVVGPVQRISRSERHHHFSSQYCSRFPPILKMPSSSSTPNETSSLLPKSNTKTPNGAAPANGSVAIAIGNDSSQQPSDPNLSKPIDYTRILGFIWPYIVPESWLIRMYMILSLFCLVLSNLCKLVPPLALKWAVDTLAQNSLGANTPTIPFLAIGVYFLARVFTTSFKILQKLFFAYVSCEQTKKFSVDVFRHLQHLDITYHMTRRTGEVQRIMGRGVESIETLIQMFVFTLLPTIFEAVIVFGIFLKLGTPAIAFVTILSVILYVIFTKTVTELRIRQRREVIDADNAIKGKRFIFRLLFHPIVIPLTPHTHTHTHCTYFIRLRKRG